MFDAGPHVTCYRAVSVADGAFAGVRCVKFANLVHCPGVPGVAFAWYGERSGPDGPCRYFGEAFNPAPGPSGGADVIGRAAGITGNGERPVPLMRLTFQVREEALGTPARVAVSGDLREDWTIVPDGVVPEHQQIQRRIERAGPLFTEYTVRKQDGSPGFGIRASLGGQSWIGAGRWRDATYLHLGTCIGPRDGHLLFGASDIAAGNTYCGAVPWGELRMQPDPQYGESLWRVAGAWSESWRLRSARV